MRKPRALMAGDQVRIVAPASPTTKESIEGGIAFLEGLGFKVALGESVFDRDGYLAGSDEDRAADLQQAFADPDVAAVVCARGGYGCARLLRHLDLDAMAASDKMFVGFSDITTLHLALNRRGLATYHAPMLLTFSVEREPWVYESFRRLLSGEDPIVDGAPRGKTLRQGVAEGPLTGGCLCLLTDSLATPDAVDCKGRIVLIEDVDENPHRVDAMLTHLENAGVLNEAAGIVVGEMTGTDERSDPKIGTWPWLRIVEDRLACWNVPIIVDYPIGHKKNMLSLPLGLRVRLNADAGTLTLLEDPCA
ncbi:MAG: LD-carboxypeptidase [Armatimonadetes bacterium]|nr:LD-carboxypeptidase [Armatimonadota bacterium]